MPPVAPRNPAALVETFLGSDPTALPPLVSLLDMLDDYCTSRRAWPRGADRREALSRTAGDIARLRRCLDGIDPLTLVRAMQGCKPVERKRNRTDEVTMPPASGPHRGKALEEVSTLSAGLRGLEAGLRQSAAEEPVPGAGRPSRDDVLVFGVECLINLWRRYRPSEPPTQSAKHGAFGHFAEAVLTAAPFRFAAGSVRKAVAAALPSSHNAT
jgi:hypothetical protein